MHIVGNRPIQGLPKFGPGDVPGRGAIGIAALGTLAGSLIAIEDIGFGNLSLSVFNQNFFDKVLNRFNSGRLSLGNGLFKQCNDLPGKFLGTLFIASIYRHGRPVDGVGNSFGCERHDASIALDNMGQFGHTNLLIVCGIIH